MELRHTNPPTLPGIWKQLRPFDMGQAVAGWRQQAKPARARQAFVVVVWSVDAITLSFASPIPKYTQQPLTGLQYPQRECGRFGWRLQ